MLHDYNKSVNSLFFNSGNTTLPNVERMGIFAINGDVLALIFSFLSPRELVKLIMACKYFAFIKELETGRNINNQSRETVADLFVEYRKQFRRELLLKESGENLGLVSVFEGKLVSKSIGRIVRLGKNIFKENYFNEEAMQVFRALIAENQWQVLGELLLRYFRHHHPEKNDGKLYLGALAPVTALTEKN